MKERYTYDGPVRIFDTIVNEHWTGTTYAVSESKAKSNLIFQYKKSHGLSAASKVTLPGKLEV